RTDTKYAACASRSRDRSRVAGDRHHNLVVGSGRTPWSRDEVHTRQVRDLRCQSGRREQRGLRTHVAAIAVRLPITHRRTRRRARSVVQEPVLYEDRGLLLIFVGRVDELLPALATRMARAQRRVEMVGIDLEGIAVLVHIVGAPRTTNVLLGDPAAHAVEGAVNRGDGADSHLSSEVVG